MVVGKVTKVKGEAILSELGWVRYKKGESGLNLILSDLNENRPTNLQVTIKDYKKNEWYPVQTQTLILQSIVNNFGDGDPEVLKEVAAHGVRKIAQFGIVLRFMNVRKVTERMGDNVMMLYRTLELKPRYPDDNTIIIDVKGFPIDKIYCNLLLGGIEEMGKILKLKNLVVDEPACQVDGKEYCAYRRRYG